MKSNSVSKRKIHDVEATEGEGEGEVESTHSPPTALTWWMNAQTQAHSHGVALDTWTLASQIRLFDEIDQWSSEGKVPSAFSKDVTFNHFIRSVVMQFLEGSVRPLQIYQTSSLPVVMPWTANMKDLWNPAMMVTHKFDGVRCLLVCRFGEFWAVHRDFEVKPVSCDSRLRMLMLECELLILDGEMMEVEQQGTSKIFAACDLIAAFGKTFVHEPFSVRYQVLKQLFESEWLQVESTKHDLDFWIFAKTYYKSLDDLDKSQSTTTATTTSNWDRKPIVLTQTPDREPSQTIVLPSDGLIFINPQSPYHCNPNLATRNLVKWKGKHTADLMVQFHEKKANNGTKGKKKSETDMKWMKNHILSLSISLPFAHQTLPEGQDIQTLDLVHAVTIVQFPLREDALTDAAAGRGKWSNIQKTLTKAEKTIPGPVQWKGPLKRERLCLSHCLATCKCEVDLKSGAWKIRSVSKETMLGVDVDTTDTLLRKLFSLPKHSSSVSFTFLVTSYDTDSGIISMGPLVSRERARHQAVSYTTGEKFFGRVPIESSDKQKKIYSELQENLHTGFVCEVALTTEGTWEFCKPRMDKKNRPNILSTFVETVVAMMCRPLHDYPSLVQSVRESQVVRNQKAVTPSSSSSSSSVAL